MDEQLRESLEEDVLDMLVASEDEDTPADEYSRGYNRGYRQALYEVQELLEYWR